MSRTAQAQSGRRAISSNVSTVPPPFESASASLKPLLTQCDPAKVYLFHIDRHKPDYKRNIFLIPVLLNGTIGLLLLWRLAIAAPQYYALILAILGLPGDATAELANATTRRQQINLMLRRAGMVLFDFILFRFIGPWPLTFFTEQPANPVQWRWKLGFRKEEVIARVSRGWDGKDLMQGTKKGGESPWFTTRILPAVSHETMAKTGYLLMDRSWDLDFQLMLDAHTLLESKQLKADDIDGVVLAHIEGPSGWCEWRWKSQQKSDQEVRKAVEILKAELEKE